MKIFITGGTGFIGRHTVRALLARGHSVMLLVLPREARAAERFFGSTRVTVVRGDLARPAAWRAALRRFRPEGAIHLGWTGIPDYGPAVSKKNLDQSLSLIEELGGAKCRRVVCAGTVWEYADQKGKRRESDALRPVNALAAAKIALSTFGRFVAADAGMEFVWARFFSVYGPGQKGHSLIPHIVTSVRSGVPFVVKNPRGGIDFVYVEDLARALVLLVSKRLPAEEHTYNIGSGRLSGVSRVVDIVCRELGVPSPRSRARTVTGCFADIRKVRRAVGWAPKTALPDGVRAAVRYCIESEKEVY